MFTHRTTTAAGAAVVRVLSVAVALCVSLTALGCTVAETAQYTQRPPATETPAGGASGPEVEVPDAPAQDEEPTLDLTEATVRRVIDGDTVLVRLSDTGIDERIRLIGVDTPESTTRHEPYGAEAAAYTKEQLPPGTKVFLEEDAELRDRYERMLAYVWLQPPTAVENGRATFEQAEQHLINAWLVRDGYAQLMTIPPNVRYQDYFARLQSAARNAERGLWALGIENSAKPDAAAPESGSARYVGNRNSMKFHLASCRWVTQMNEANKVPLATRSEATKAGYQPCKVCRP